MRTLFWIRRFVLIFAGAFVLLSTIYVMRGRALKDAVAEAALWSAIAAALFIATRLYYSSQGRRCELCKDMPDEMPHGSGEKKAD
jgi:multisubunit Na+/H+ antiporter MnhF subunit